MKRGTPIGEMADETLGHGRSYEINSYAYGGLAIRLEM